MLWRPVSDLAARASPARSTTCPHRRCASSVQLGLVLLYYISIIPSSEQPGADELDAWIEDVTRHTMIHENLKKFMDGFHYDAHPMAMLMSTVAALSTFYPEARSIHDAAVRQLQITRLIGKMPTLTAYAYRHSLGLPYVYPDNDLGYTKNFMHMLWKRTEPKFSANPVLARALEVLFILHADHEQNCSTSAMRAVGSSFADPYATTAAAIAALSGPLHGGANEEVLRMLDEIGSKDRVPAYIEQIKTGRGKLMGFGHRVYKNYGPRARIIKQVAEEVFEVTGRNPKLDLTWTSIPASSTRPWDSRRTCSPCCSPFRAPSAGWRSGRRCCRMANRRSRARARSIPASRSGRWCGSRSGYCAGRIRPAGLIAPSRPIWISGLAGSGSGSRTSTW